jgi:hypothetical protein
MNSVGRDIFKAYMKASGSASNFAPKAFYEADLDSINCGTVHAF